MCVKFHDQVRIGRPSIKSRSRETTLTGNLHFRLYAAIPAAYFHTLVQYRTSVVLGLGLFF